MIYYNNNHNNIKGLYRHIPSGLKVTEKWKETYWLLTLLNQQNVAEVVFFFVNSYKSR
jgi:hypothetical protein